MSITRNNPNVIHLAGPITRVGAEETDTVGKNLVGVAATPGMLAEMYSNGGVATWRPNTSATEQCPLVVFLEHGMFNKDLDDAYSVGDVPELGFMRAGSVFQALIASGQNVTVGDALQSAGDGTLKAATATTAAANVYKFQALDSPGAVVAQTRLRVQVIQ